jgi:hypothetical protein
MRSWKARVTERKTFLEVNFDEDDGLLDEPCLRHSRSEPALSQAAGASKTRVMVDQFSKGPSDIDIKDTETTSSWYKSNAMLYQFSGCGMSDITADMKEKSSASSGCESTIEPLETSASESEDAQSHLKPSRFAYVSGEDAFSYNVAGGDDEVYSQIDDTQTFEFESRLSNHKRSRPCKGQRMRYRKALNRAMMEIEKNPDFNVEDATMPISIFEDTSRKRNFVERLQAYQDRLRRESEIDALIKPLIQKQHPIQTSGAIDPSLWSTQMYVGVGQPLSCYGMNARMTPL